MKFKIFFRAREVIVATSRRAKKRAQIPPYIYRFLFEKLLLILYMGVS